MYKLCRATNLPVFKGDKVRVRESNRTYIAQEDIISNPVLVIGDRVLGKDKSTVRLTRSLEVLESRTSGEEGSLPWAYLFSVDDFSISTTNYTDTSWEINNLEGFWQELGDGGGRQKTYQDLVDNWADNYDLADGSFYNKTFLWGRHDLGIDEIVRYGREVYFGIKPENVGMHDFAVGINRIGDGVKFYKFPLTFGENESQSSFSTLYNNGGLIPDRQYWIQAPDMIGAYSYIWERSGGSVGVRGDKNGEIQRTYSVGAYSASLENGEFSYSWDVSRGSSPPQSTLDLYRADAFASWNNLEQAGYIPVSFPDLDGRHHLQIYTGQQIIDGDAYTVLEYQGYIPDEIQIRWGGGAFSVTAGVRRTSNRLLAVQFCYLLPVLGQRSPGDKSIYVQVSSNQKTLLHVIPSFEPWDGYVSPLENGEIEVVLQCGKRWTPVNLNEQRDINAFPNEQRNNNSFLYDLVFFSREWSQVRVYRLDASGTIIPSENNRDVEIFNNALTDLNPSEIPDEIVIAPDNWQIEWLNTYADWRTPTAYTIESESGSINTTWYTNQITKRYAQYTGDFNPPPAMENLNTALRTHYSQRHLSRFKNVERNLVARQLIHSVGLGTLYQDRFFYVDPLDLFDLNVAIDNSFSALTRTFPTPNYTILSGLLNQAQTNKTFYEAIEFYYNGSFDPGIAIPQTTEFPRLDLAELELPQEFLAADRQIDNPTLLRVGLKAIAYLGSY